jgi:hypothetical protein
MADALGVWQVHGTAFAQISQHIDEHNTLRTWSLNLCAYSKLDRQERSLRTFDT